MNEQVERDEQGIAERIVAKCMEDEAFKQRLLADPAGTLRAEGLSLPPGLSDKALENTVQAIRLAIPERQTDLADAQLAGAAGGGAIDSMLQSVLVNMASSMT